MTTNPKSKREHEQQPSLLITLLFFMIAAVGAWFFVANYRNRAKPTREMSLSANEPSIAANSNAELASEYEFRKSVREADQRLLETVAEKKLQYASEPLPRHELEGYVDDYSHQLLTTVRSAGPEALPLMEDIKARLEDPDLQAAAPYVAAELKKLPKQPGPPVRK